MSNHHVIWCPCTLCMPRFVSSTIGSLFGGGRGLWDVGGALMKNRNLCMKLPPHTLIQSKSYIINVLLMWGKHWIVFVGSTLMCRDHLGEGTGSGLGRGMWGDRLCFYLRDCNNNHTSATGLVASIILSTVEQNCMGVKTILVCVFCLCVCLKEKRGELMLECAVVECAFTYSSSFHALPQTGNTPLPLLCV